MADVALDRVSKSFNQTPVIRDISLEVRDREFIVLVGPSGCGKSTVLRMIAGLESITSGQIRIGERVVNDVAPKDRDIAMVFQNYALYPHMSVYDNMAFGLKMRKTPKAVIRQKVQDAARILDIEPLLNRKPRELSGGQRQRVALGRAIVRDPKVFLMDEPLSNLDAKLRVQMRSEITKLHQRLNATSIYVTHDQVEAMTMGDRIVILNQGEIQQVDTPLAVYQRPANMFVAGFVGQMNFLTAVVQGKGQDQRLQLADGALLSLSSETIEALASHPKESVIAGFRPEALLWTDTPGVPNAFTMTLERVELLGSEQLLHGALAGGPLIARWPSDRSLPPLGESVAVGLDSRHLLLFDPATEQRIQAHP